MFLDAPASEEINFQSMNLVTNHQNIINHNPLLADKIFLSVFLVSKLLYYFYLMFCFIIFFYICECQS